MLSDIPLYATIPVKDLKKSIDFYSRTLGMDIIDEDEMGVWYHAGKTRFALYVSEFAGMSKAPAAIWLVHQPEKLVSILISRGVEFEIRDSHGNKITDKGKMYVRGGYKAAWFKDPSGNIICIAGYN